MPVAGQSAKQDVTNQGMNPEQEHTQGQEPLRLRVKLEHCAHLQLRGFVMDLCWRVRRRWNPSQCVRGQGDAGGDRAHRGHMPRLNKVIRPNLTVPFGATSSHSPQYRGEKKKMMKKKNKKSSSTKEWINSACSIGEHACQRTGCVIPGLKQTEAEEKHKPASPGTNSNRGEKEINMLVFRKRKPKREDV